MIGPLRLHRDRWSCRGFGRHPLGLVFKSHSCVSHRCECGHLWTSPGRHLGVRTDVRGVLTVAVELLVRNPLVSVGVITIINVGEGALAVAVELQARTVSLIR